MLSTRSILRRALRHVGSHLALVAILLGAQSSHAHVSYSGRDFGTFAATGAETPKVISIGNVSSAFGWAAATDDDFGDSHRTRAFRVTLTNPAVLTLRVEGTTVGAAPPLPYPGFSIYQGLCHVAPQQSDHDSSAISAEYLATLDGTQPKAGALVALGDFRIGNDPTYNVSGDATSGILYPAELSHLIYIGHAADGTSANYGSAAGIQGDGTANGDVVKSFVLPAGNFSIFIGGGDYSAISPGPTWPSYGIKATLSVAAIAPPTITVPSTIVATATSGAGAAVDFSVSATDAAGKALVATPSIPSGSTFNLGSTTVNVTTIDSLGQIATSSFTVTVNPSTDATLASLSASGAALAPSFASSTTSYTGTVGNAVNSITISAQSSFPGSTVQQTPANPVALSVGSNNVSVVVTAQDGSTTKTYTVNITRTVADTTKPSLTITSPRSSVTGSFDIAGTVKEMVYLSSLHFSLNGAPPVDISLPARSGSAIPWSVTGLTPENGPNVIVVDAIDLNGNAQRAIKSFTYVNSTLGSSAIGSYTGLLVPAGALTDETSGCISVTINSTAAFSGKITLGGLTFPISGVLANSGQARFRPSLDPGFTLVDRTEFDSVLGSVSFALNSGKLTGELRTEAGGGALLATLEAKRSLYDGKTPGTTIQQASGLLNLGGKGSYNVAFPARAQSPSLAPEAFPQGDGFASVSLSSAGTVAIKGTLADGSAFSASGRLADDLTVPIYAQLYRKGGSIAGSLKFDVVPDDTDVASVGAFVWIRPGRVRALHYAEGFAITTTAIGTQYSGASSVDFGQGPEDLTLGNAELSFSAGGLTTALQRRVNVNPSTGAVRLIAPSDYALTVNPGSGTLTGSFLYKTTPTVPFRGLLLNKGSNRGGFGFFASPFTVRYGAVGESGRIRLNP